MANWRQALQSMHRPALSQEGMVIDDECSAGAPVNPVLDYPLSDLSIPGV
jgi:hypothetical protein